MGEYYDDQWRELKRRRKLTLIAFIGCVLIAFAAFLSPKLFSTGKPALAFTIAWMVFGLVAGARYNTFPCPRCGEWFFSTWWYHNSFARRCVHCKLPLYSTKEEAAGPY
jgi:hypothetical protein